MAGTGVTDLDETTFAGAIAGGPVLVDFWAPWCRPCKAVEPILAELSIPLARVNVDDEPGIASRYEVLSIPTVILFEGGEPKASVVGARPRGHFEQVFGEWLSETNPSR